MPPAQPDDRADTRPDSPEPIGDTPPTPTGVRTRSVMPAGLALLALGVLAVLAALVFIALPAWLSSRPAAPPPAQPVEAPPASRQTTTYDPQVSVRARLTAEEAVSRYLEARAELERQGAELWAGEDLAAAERRADEGEAALTERDFPRGTALYRQATDRLQTIAARAPTVYAEALERGMAALSTGDPPTAVEAFEIAVAIDPDAPEAARGLARARRLEEVLTLLSQGAAHEDEGELEKARTAYEQVVAIDPELARASEALARVEERLAQQRFEALMSEGLAGLARADWRGARESFTAAGRLRPGDPGVADGLAQAEEGLQRQRIAALERKARSLESAERWQEALGVYDELLAVDPALDLARRGRARSERMARLHVQMDYLLAEPERLYSERVREEAGTLLARARSVESPGPRLADALARLERAVDRAGAPRTVRLTSDGATEITIYRVGELGSFRERSIALTPGTYTVVGSRPGYRDVRREIVIRPDEPAPTLHVACEEPV
jgi:tetratricopeptide (TPR) repeat protein